MSYSIDSHEKVLAVREKERLSFAKVAKRFDIGLSTVVRWSREITSKLTWWRVPKKIPTEALKGDLPCSEALRSTYKKTLKHSKADPRKTVCLLPNGNSL